MASRGFERFASRGAYYLGKINASPRFCEKNGRAQRELNRELGELKKV
jgi:hypothetical protein